MRFWSEDDKYYESDEKEDGVGFNLIEVKFDGWDFDRKLKQEWMYFVLV